MSDPLLYGICDNAAGLWWIRENQWSKDPGLAQRFVSREDANVRAFHECAVPYSEWRAARLPMPVRETVQSR